MSEMCTEVYTNKGDSAYQNVYDKCRLQAGHDGQHVGWQYSWYSAQEES